MKDLSTLTLPELEQYLDRACAEFVFGGGRIVRYINAPEFNSYDYACVLGAADPPNNFFTAMHYTKTLGLPRPITNGIINGFHRDEPGEGYQHGGVDPEAYAIGERLGNKWAVG